MFTVYIIYSIKFDKYYIGMSSDTVIRLKAHNAGHVKSTKPYRPWKYIYQEEHKTRIEARNREKYLKSAAGRRWRKNNLGM
ncbi:GIY-YIG nuclease family protein [Winogradskyella forsetii]|uniref:GIY-YIG nuclease family protein n=1 Tax=Winogradskyella forsetii TaxID=2686077 RepID=UPI0015B90733|nr:GIY-YIG nuclease family protein [Winogradskyella forsetii]